MAERTKTTFQLLKEFDARPKRQLREFGPEVTGYQQDSRVEMETSKFIKNLRSARRGLSPGVGGTRNEHLKILLEDDKGLDALCLMASYFAEGDVPDDIIEAMRLGKMTALRKSPTKVRGLNAGELLRRLVAKTLTQQYGKEFEMATLLCNFGLAAHGGAEALVHF